MKALANYKFFLIILFDSVCGLPYECTKGFWGSQCDKECGECEGGPQFCHVHDGRCVNGCAAGYTGAKCKKACDPGTHGPYCRYKCGECSDISPICDSVSGECKGGCKVGYQKPFCKLRCPLQKWGENCESSCVCHDDKCGCHPVLGYCEKCGADGKPKVVELEDPVNMCINPFIYEDIHSSESSKRVLKIPWVPILSFLGLVGGFIATKFVYWYCWVRAPEAKEVVRIVRGERPHLDRVESWSRVREQIDEYNRGEKRVNAISFRNQDLDLFMDRQAFRLQRQQELFQEVQMEMLEDELEWEEPHHYYHDDPQHDQHHHYHHGIEEDVEHRESWDSYYSSSSSFSSTV